MYLWEQRKNGRTILYFSNNFINELGEIVNHSLYPNPAVDGFQISNDELVESITIITATGERLLSQAHRSGHRIDTSELPAGSYLVTMFDKNSKSTGVERFVKSGSHK